MNNQIVLGYWPILSIVQPCKSLNNIIKVRAFLNYVNLPYVDKIYTDRAQWFMRDRLKFNDKHVHLPYLQEGKKIYYETDALFYVIANKVNRLDLLGIDGSQMAKVALARSLIESIRVQLQQQQMRPKSLRSLRRKLEIFEQILSNSQFVAGDTITYVDFCFWQLVNEMINIGPINFDRYEKIKKFYKIFMEIPENKEFLQKLCYINTIHQSRNKTQ